MKGVVLVGGKGSRLYPLTRVADWLFVEDYCCAIALALEKARPDSIYNVSSSVSEPNLKIVRTILQVSLNN